MIGILYTITVYGLAVAKAKIVTPAWINVPASAYYYNEHFHGTTPRVVQKTSE